MKKNYSKGRSNAYLTSNIIKLLILIIITLYSTSSRTQSVVENLDKDAGTPSQELAEERIVKISPSRKIFLITRNNTGLNNGDYISLLLNNRLAARALVAKTKDNVSGIKIKKIYSLSRWYQLKENTSVQVLRGDDSYYKLIKEKKEKEEGDEDRITDEDDLFDTTIEEDDFDLEDKSAKHIKTDNIVGLFAGQIESKNLQGGDQNYPHYGVTWSYQFHDNIWGEFVYGYSKLTQFPADDLDTTLTNISLKLKYTFEAPLNSYLQPYGGFQIISASSPSAGDSSTAGANAQTELNLLASAEKKSVIFGVSILKRLVPGWFLKADLGTDMINAGFSLEF